jgi:maltooligosyltrehalose trehalohydrolase
MTDPRRRAPIGAEVVDGGAHFRVWAPKATHVDVLLSSGVAVPLAADRDGYFAGIVRGAGAGDRYKYRLDGGEAFPDPASRYQPDGPHGPSEIVDPNAFPWTDTDWKGIGPKGRVLYELHVGTLTKAGTYAGVEELLPKLADVGIDTLEIMPVHEFPGRFGWGYDGVDLFAPSHLYGTPDDLRRLVDRAHSLGLGVILDVVYNHFGPDGNYLTQYSDSYFARDVVNDWGDCIDFDGPTSRPVREMFVANAAYWIDEFHFDGLRLDATQSIHDSSRPHIVTELTLAARGAAPYRQIYVIAENEEQDIALVRERGVDALWNDDFHHSALVAMTGKREAYYSDYLGTAQELISALKWGYLFQGQRYEWQDKPRGTPSPFEPAERYVLYLENHDQVANRAFGARTCTTTTPGRFRAMSAVLLLAPSTPLLFQGQELGSTRPWVYFADHPGELGESVKKGRAQFLAQFPSMNSEHLLARVSDPRERATFESCVLDASLHDENPPTLRLYRALLRLRRRDPVFASQDKDRMFGATLGAERFALRYFGDDGDDRLVLVNLSTDRTLRPAPEPLLAPPRDRHWEILLSTDDPSFGGEGIAPLHAGGALHLPSHAALVLAAKGVTP